MRLATSSLFQEALDIERLKVLIGLFKNAH